MLYRSFIQSLKAECAQELASFSSLLLICSLITLEEGFLPNMGNVVQQFSDKGGNTVTWRNYSLVQTNVD